MTSSSMAMSTAAAVSTLVTEASGNVRSRSPWAAMGSAAHRPRRPPRERPATDRWIRTDRAVARRFVPAGALVRDPPHDRRRPASGIERDGEQPVSGVGAGVEQVPGGEIPEFSGPREGVGVGGAE